MKIRSIRGVLERRCRVYPADEVTSLAGSAEVEPEAGGLTRGAVDAIWRSVVGLYRTGLMPAMALCIRRRGQVVIDRAIGHERGNAPGARAKDPKVVATPTTLFNLFSASKAVTAMLIHLLDERGEIHLDDAVAEYIPEFAKHGKEWVTIRHVLTHRAGIPTVPGARFDPDMLSRPGEIVALLCDTKPVSVAGRRLAYHALTGGFLLAEIIRRVTGGDIQSFLSREIRKPLGFRHFGYGVDPSEIDRVTPNEVTGPPTLPPASWALQRALGVSHEEAVALSNDPRFLTGVVPSGNVVATANEVSRFYELLLRGGKLDRKRIFDRRTVKRAVAEQTYLEVDLTIGLPIRYGMGFMLGGRTFSLYGPGTPQAFGHQGFTFITSYADPERDIAVCLMTSGKPFLTWKAVYWWNVVRAIAQHCPRLSQR
jgi:CubicO group peptidase (beta-lactamase class C family)